MSVAILPVERFQDLIDGPGELTARDDGRVPMWSADEGRLIMVPLPEATSPQRIIVRGGGGGGGGASTIAGAEDFAGTPGAGTDGYAIVWDNAAGVFTLGTFEAAGEATAAIAAHVAEANPHTQYLLASGVSAYGATLIDDADAATARTTLGLGTMATATETSYLLADGSRTGATSSLQPFTSGVVTGIVRPASDSTTAVRVQNAAGSSDVMTVDTTNKRIGIGTTPAQALDVSGVTITRNLDNGRTITIDPGNTAIDSSDNLQVNRFSAKILAIGSNSDSRLHVGQNVALSKSAGAKMAVGNEAATIISLLIGGNTAGHTADLLVVADYINTASPYTLNQKLMMVGPTGITTIQPRSAVTNAIQNNVKVGHNTSGTPTAGFGSAINMQLQSSTTAGQDAGRLSYEWVTATHASRAARGKLTAYYTSTEQEAMRWDGDSGGVKLGFYGQAAVARQLLATGAGATVDDVITALQNLGLLRQS